jgi:hypothetical protein
MGTKVRSLIQDLGPNTIGGTTGYMLRTHGAGFISNPLIHHHFSQIAANLIELGVVLAAATAVSNGYKIAKAHTVPKVRAYARLMRPNVTKGYAKLMRRSST